MSPTRPKRRDSSPIGQFLLDQSRKSLRAVKSRAISFTADDSSQPSSSTTTPINSSNSTMLSSLTSFLGNTNSEFEQFVGDFPLPSSSGLNFQTQKNDMVFEQISYLGCSKIVDPVSESEMLQIIANFNAEKSHDAVNIVLIIPATSTRNVRLLENVSNVEICSFPVHRIRFCARGQPISSERACFALSFTQFNTSSAALHQCHVFRCQVPEAAGRALISFANAFRNNEPQISSLKETSSLTEEDIPINKLEEDSKIEYVSRPDIEEDFQFEAFLEIKELDSKKGYAICPVEKNCFKMRRDREKQVVVVLRQTDGPRQLVVKKCFGLLLAAGRNLRQSDFEVFNLLDIQSMAESQNNSRVYIIEANWNPTAHNFEVLNTETPKETRVFMTIAIDVILSGINEPVRFNIECKARIFQQFERFWYIPRRAIIERYFLTIKMDEKPPVLAMNTGEGDFKPADSTTAHPSNPLHNISSDSFKVVKFESVTERERSVAKLSFGGRSPTKMPTQLIHLAEDDESDSDEPLLSGSGQVNRECSDDLLLEWRNIIEKWKEEPDKRPTELNAIINDGIPDVLRGQVWQLLAKVYVDADLGQTYRMLLDKECPSEQVILRDIHRTFPAHEYFKESNGVGQEALYKISKAYSLYDEEVSYCQGLSFLAAALLLHMPEEQAFCVLIKIMFDYGLRDLFKLGFDTLHLRFYQLQRLIEDYEHELFNHFYGAGVETHMYASQWFLTLFTAKFPLQMVFFIVDLFLSEGVNTIFHISLALLQDSKKDLLQLDFEGILKYFRVTLPRKYRTETNAKELIHNAVKLKISHKRLSKYEKEYYTLKQRELESLDPLERLERENFRLKETILRLERENDDLAHELVTSKIELRNKLDMTEDQLETTVAAIERQTRKCEELYEETKNHKAESELVKNMCRQEVSRLDEEVKRSQSVIEQYKKICTDLGRTFEADKQAFEQEKRSVAAQIVDCKRCSTVIYDWIAENSPRGTRHQIPPNNLAAENNLDSNEISSEDALPQNGLDGNLINNNGQSISGNAFHIVRLMDRLEEREDHIRQIELELAQTKLALVEAQCQNQDLAHQMSTSISNAENNDITRPAWFKKTISSIREVAQTSLKNQQNTSQQHHRSYSNTSMEKQ